MPLPAPYAPPWKRLWEDGVAMTAWLGLKVRELWRLNGEGALAVPGFWPRRWPQLFWPLILLALLVVGAILIQPWLSGPPVSTPPPLQEAFPAPGLEFVPMEEKEAPVLNQPVEDEPREQDSGPEHEAGPELDAEATGEKPSQPVVAPQPGEPPGSKAEPEAEGDAEAEGLLTQWKAEDPDHLLEAISEEPATATLTLELNGSFFALPGARRQTWAERWQERATDLGYSHLRLVDRQQRLVGREALVGRGMVLLLPSTPPSQ